MSTFALAAGEAQLAEGFSGVVLVRIGFELGADQRLDFLHGGGGTLADRHLTTASLGADSSVYIDNIHK